MHNFGDGRKVKDANYHPHVLVGLADGTLVSYSFKENRLKDKKLYPLGDTPVSLAVCTADGRSAVFASGSRAAVMYWDRQRLQRSTVMLKVSISVAKNHFHRSNTAAFVGYGPRDEFEHTVFPFVAGRSYSYEHPRRQGTGRRQDANQIGEWFPA